MPGDVLRSYSSQRTVRQGTYFIKCLGDGIGIRATLKMLILWVRVPPKVPRIVEIEVEYDQPVTFSLDTMNRRSEDVSWV